MPHKLTIISEQDEGNGKRYIKEFSLTHPSFDMNRINLIETLHDAIGALGYEPWEDEEASSD